MQDVTEVQERRAEETLAGGHQIQTHAADHPGNVSQRGEREREPFIKININLCFLDFREEVRSVPDQLLAYTRSKHYLHATELLNNSGE